MILDGKYIILRKNQIKPILNYLYSIGYNWPSTLNYNTENYEISNELYHKFESIAIMSIENKRLQYFLTSEIHFNVDDRTFLDINKIIREHKLKYILK